jgi:hypothetical protein
MHPLSAQASGLTHEVSALPLKYTRIKAPDCWNRSTNGVNGGEVADMESLLRFLCSLLFKTSRNQFSRMPKLILSGSERAASSNIILGILREKCAHAPFRRWSSVNE